MGAYRSPHLHIQTENTQTCSPGGCNSLTIKIMAWNTTGYHSWVTGRTWGIGLYATRRTLGMGSPYRKSIHPRTFNPLIQTGAFLYQYPRSLTLMAPMTPGKIAPVTPTQNPQADLAMPRISVKVHQLLNHTKPDTSELLTVLRSQTPLIYRNWPKSDSLSF